MLRKEQRRARWRGIVDGFLTDWQVRLTVDRVKRTVPQLRGRRMAGLTSQSGVIAVEESQNRKIGAASATYVAQQSCHKSCPFRGKGCYAELGLTGIQTRRINARARLQRLTSYQLSQREAQAIDTLSGTRPLRMHVVGDATSTRAARLLAHAAQRYIAKHGQPVWTYTHSWRLIDRDAWGPIAVLASTESLADATAAMARGYAASTVVRAFDSPKATVTQGVKVIPCPEQTGRSASCATCQLCWRPDALLQRKAVIAFAAHGSRKNALPLKEVA